MAEFPIRKENAARVFQTILHFLPPQYNNYNIRVLTDNKDLEELIPAYYDPERRITDKNR